MNATRTTAQLTEMALAPSNPACNVRTSYTRTDEENTADFYFTINSCSTGQEVIFEARIYGDNPDLSHAQATFGPSPDDSTPNLTTKYFVEDGKVTHLTHSLDWTNPGDFGEERQRKMTPWTITALARLSMLKMSRTKQK